MPSVLDTSTHVHAVETADLYTTKPQHRLAPRSFWSTLMQSIRRGYAPRSIHQMPRQDSRVPYPMEGPADRLARQSPHLYLQAFAGAS